MKKLATVLLIGLIKFGSFAQTITPTYFYDDFSTTLSSNITYSTLYNLYYTSLTRNTTDQRFEVVVDPKVNEWRPIVLGLTNSNNGDGIDISTYPIMKIRVQVPSTTEIPSNSKLKLAFYISDDIALGEYDFITDEDYLEPSIATGSDVIFTYDWRNAKFVEDWGVWPPQTGCTGPNLKHIKSIGFSMNTNSTAKGTYYIKSIELGTSSSLPFVELSSPACGANYDNNETITLNANQSYSNATIDSIRFYDGNILLGIAKTTPFTYDWQNASIGDHAVKAIAYYDNKETATSQSLRLKVNQVTAIQDAVVENNSFYPNPASSNIHFSKKMELVKIMNLQGNTLLQMNNVDQVDINNLEIGMYLVVTENGFSKLIVK